MSDADSLKQMQEAIEGESKSLEILIQDTAESPQTLDLAEIVQIYYRVINVSAMIKAVKQQSSAYQCTIEKTITEVFDVKIHVSILSQLSQRISESISDLKKIKKNKTKDEMQSRTALFERLREMMSTKEFVEQYNKVSSDD